MRHRFLTGCFLLLAPTLPAAAPYVAPKEPEVRENLARWGDRRFGLMMHWGPYAQEGLVESWSICPEPWIDRHGPYAKTYDGYVRHYGMLAKSFDPVRFDPAKWARAAKEAGMGYVVFTTKHHDGFCMFDTKTTDYRITGPDSAFAGSPKADATRAIFDAFRAEDFMIGAYFSKPDWHNENYWWPYYPPKDRNVNYDTKKFPERWNAFRNFTREQIGELMSGYGRIDILWLDGGWVRPLATVDASVDWQRAIPYDQDLDMARIAAESRVRQPWLIVVDRTVGGEFENYTTPEQEVPEHGPDHPWETCMTIAGAWSHYPGDTYKSSAKLIRTLVTVVSGGGNFLLNIAPDKHGEWDPAAYDRLRDIGAWMKLNGEGILRSRRGPLPSSGNIRYTASGDGGTTYAYRLSEDGEKLPDTVVLPGLRGTGGMRITALGDETPLKWKSVDAGTEITLPEVLLKQRNGTPALGFKINR